MYGAAVRACVLWTHQHARKVKLVTVLLTFCVSCIQVLEELHHLHHCSFVSRVDGSHRILEHHISRWAVHQNGYIVDTFCNLF